MHDITFILDECQDLDIIELKSLINCIETIIEEKESDE